MQEEKSHYLIASRHDKKGSVSYLRGWTTFVVLDELLKVTGSFCTCKYAANSLKAICTECI